MLDRREFVSLSLASLAALSVDSPAHAQTTKSGSFKPDTLFLTWQRDPTTTMTVQWIGKAGETSDTSINYTPVPPPVAKGAAAPTLTWQSQKTVAKLFDAKTKLQTFRSELTGLKPGADYQFRIGKHSTTYRFRTMPAKATDTISFISGGDCAANEHTVANNKQAARQDPAFAVIGGDLGYDDGKNVDVAVKFIRNYSQQMIARGGRLIPMIACIGNHEVDGGYEKPRTKAPYFYSLFDGLFPDTGYATLDFGDYLSLVLLDTNHTSAVAGEQTSWLEKTLQARAEHPNVMVVNHVPAYPSFRPVEGKEGKKGTGEENRKHWVPLFEKYRVPVVLEHHDHTFKRTKPLIAGLSDPNGVLYLGDGSWGKLRAPTTPAKLNFLATSSQDYHLSLHRIQGEERFHLALDENGRVMDLWRSAQRVKGNVSVPG